MNLKNPMVPQINPKNPNPNSNPKTINTLNLSRITSNKPQTKDRNPLIHNQA